MSSQGRPEGEYRRAEHEGSPVSGGVPPEASADASGQTAGSGGATAP